MIVFGFTFHSAFLAVPISKTGEVFVLFQEMFPLGRFMLGDKPFLDSEIISAWDFPRVIARGVARAGRRGTGAFGFVSMFGIVLFFPHFSNIARIMLFGSFLDLMNLPTAFDAIHFPISDTPHRKSHMSIFQPQLTIFPAHSIAPIESTNPPIFWRLNTISRATVSP